MHEKTRRRGANFTTEEQLLLFDIIKPLSHIIECKKLSKLHYTQKQNAWAEVTKLYNYATATDAEPRTTASLMGCYKKMKRTVRNEQSESKTQESKSDHSESEDSKEFITKFEDCSKILDVMQDVDQNTSKEDIEENTHDLHTQSGTKSLTIPKNMRPALSEYGERCRQKNQKRIINRSIHILRLEKIQLIKLQKKLIKMDITHKEKVHKLELENLIEENKFKEEMRKKEMLMINNFLTKNRKRHWIGFTSNPLIKRYFD